MSTPEPSGEDCMARRIIAGSRATQFATFYPQMGGYSGKCIVEIDSEGGCFDADVWHDGEFPFSGENGRRAHRIHHCMPEQFVRFGTDVLEAQALHPRRGTEEREQTIRQLAANLLKIADTLAASRNP